MCVVLDGFRFQVLDDRNFKEGGPAVPCRVSYGVLCHIARGASRARGVPGIKSEAGRSLNSRSHFPTMYRPDQGPDSTIIDHRVISCTTGEPPSDSGFMSTCQIVSGLGAR